MESFVWKRLRFCALIILAAPLGDFCTESLLEKDFDFAHVLCYSGCTLRRLLHRESFGKKTSILRTYCAIPAAPLGDFCTESLLEKDFNYCTCCSVPAVPLGDFCTENLLEKDFDFAHLLCYSGCTLRRLLHGESF
jgi:hypothetical protein